MSDESALIIRWQAGDEDAAEAIYNRYRDRVFRLAYGLLGNPTDAEDAAQDALTYALTNIDRYAPQRGSFRTWLHTITVSRCRDLQRRRRMPLSSLTVWMRRGGDVPDPTVGQEQQVIRAEVRGEVWRAVQDLSPRLREAVFLRYWAGHTYREMAEIMDCPVPTAQSRVRLAYQRLRLILAPENLGELDLEEKVVR
jgi:RNA polymerase sigma-70 factor (ECF subfamily)